MSEHKARDYRWPSKEEKGSSLWSLPKENRMQMRKSAYAVQVCILIEDLRLSRLNGDVIATWKFLFIVAITVTVLEWKQK